MQDYTIPCAVFCRYNHPAYIGNIPYSRYTCQAETALCMVMVNCWLNGLSIYFADGVLGTDAPDTAFRLQLNPRIRIFCVRIHRGAWARQLRCSKVALLLFPFSAFGRDFLGRR